MEMSFILYLQSLGMEPWKLFLYHLDSYYCDRINLCSIIWQKHFCY
jgi:hypothetical protein